VLIDYKKKKKKTKGWVVVLMDDKTNAGLPCGIATYNTQTVENCVNV
jgi:hypothetical protein